MSHPEGTAGALLAQLRQIVGESHVISDPAGMAGWLIDVRRSYEGEALAVVEVSEWHVISPKFDS